MLIRRRMFVFCFSFFVSSLIFSSLSQSAKLVSAAFFACALAVSAILLRRCSADGDKRKNSPFRGLTEKNKIRIFAVFFSSLLLASLFSAFTFFRMYGIPERSVTDDEQISASVVSRIWSSSGSGGYKVRFRPPAGKQFRHLPLSPMSPLNRETCSPHTPLCIRSPTRPCRAANAICNHLGYRFTSRCPTA